VWATDLLILSLSRQALIMGGEDFTPLTGLLGDVVHWRAGLEEMRCADTIPTASDLLAAYGAEASGLWRSASKLAGFEKDALALDGAERACFGRLKYAAIFDDTEVETIPTFKVSIDVTASPVLKNQNKGASPLVTGKGDFDFHSVSVNPTNPSISNVVVTHTGGALTLMGEVTASSSLGCVNHALAITRSAQLGINPLTGISSSDEVDWMFLYLNTPGSDAVFPVNEWQAFTVASWPPKGPPKWVITLASDGTKWTDSFNFVDGAGTGVVDFSATPSKG
jgi:hypothetical protein